MTEMLRLRWLGQAGFTLSADGTTIVIDAFLSDRPDRLFAAPVTAESLSGADAFFATHEHRDHLDVPTWPRFATAAARARFVVPLPVVPKAREAVPAERLVGAKPGKTIEVGAARITPVPARHGVHMADAYSFGLVPGEHRYLGYVVELGGLRVYHAGDTIRYDGQAERLRELAVDVALLPINGRDAAREARGLVGNLTAAEASDLAADAGIPVVVPMHYELFAHNAGRASELVDHAASAHPSLSVIVLGRYGGIEISR